MGTSDNIKKVLLNTKEVQIQWGICKSTLEKLRVYGGGPKFIKRGRSVFYTAESIQSWLASHQRSSTSDNGLEG